MSLNLLKDKQLEVDKKSFFIKDKQYDHLSPNDIIRHNCFHLMNLAGKVSRYCEQEEHNIDISTEQIIKEVIPDLIVYALQFSNVLDIDLDRAYEERLHYILNKYPI